MRQVITWLVILSCCAYLGCGSGTTVKNISQVDAEKANSGLASDTYDGPSRTAAAAQTPAATPNARPGTESTPAAANSRPARPSSGPPLAGEGDNPPPLSGASPSATTKAPAQLAPARPSSGPPLAGEGDNPPPFSGAVPGATTKSPAQTTPPPAGNLASEGDDFDAPSAQAPPRSAAPNVATEEGPTTSTPAAGGAGIAGGKGGARPNAAGGGAGIAGGKGASAPAAPSTVAVVESGPMTLLDQASKSFDEFREFDATQRLYAHWLTDTEAMGEYPLQWVAGIAEPRLFFRWGVGVVYTAPTDFGDQPPLIGDPVAATTPPAARGGGRGGRGGLLNESAPNTTSASPYAGVDQSTPTGNLLYYTGDFGERLLKRLDSRRLHKEFFYGKILAISKFKSPEFAQARTTTTTLTTPGTQAPQHAILLGDTEAETTQTVTTTTARNARNTSGVVATTGTLVPGVIFLGTESDTDAEKVLLERGKTSGVDAVLIFYVTVKEKSRSDSAYSTTKLGVHNLKNPDDKKETGSLSSETVAKTRQREKNSDNDPVELALDKIFNDFSDTKLRVSTMPTIKPENAKNRVDALVAEIHTNPLPAVVEILNYHKAGLLDEASTIAAIGKLTGGDEVAQKLLSGTPEEKLAVVEKWLPRDSANPVQSSGEKFR